jgi:hypothetical protein
METLQEMLIEFKKELVQNHKARTQRRNYSHVGNNMKGKPKEITTMQEVLSKERKFMNKYLCFSTLRIE